MKFDSLENVSGTPVITGVNAARQLDGLYATFGKRLFDIVLSLLLLPILIPVIGVLWVVTKRDGGAGFFGHERIGKDGKTFQCWKVRTMVVDAGAKLDAYLAANPAAADEWARDFKLEDDPRVTRFGNFLRRTSLDELPQILNVLKGEMSLVGPRPIVDEELARYGHSKAAYLAMSPGVTGLWQVSGRNDVSYDERVALDVKYGKSMTLFGDVMILLKTVGAVTKRTGK